MQADRFQPAAAAIFLREAGSRSTLGNAAAAGVRLIVWCRDCGHQVEPDPAKHARRYGAEMTVLEWREELGVLPLSEPQGRYGS